MHLPLRPVVTKHATLPAQEQSGPRAKVTDPVVPSLVLVVHPVEVFIGAELHTVLGHPLVSVTAPLCEDP